MKRCFALLALLITCLPMASAQDTSLGVTTFTNSGAPEAQAPFLRGILLLHSFEYADAAEAFRDAQQADPDFAMAYWGEAMTYNHPLWYRQNLEAAQEVLSRLAPTAEARLAKAKTDRERAYLEAAHILFGAGDKQERDDAFMLAMEQVHNAFPDDLDAAAFYALSILGTAHEGRDFAIYMRAAAVAQRVFQANPQHPGAAHYLIHSFDDPIHAPLGLDAADAYSEIAPSATHALHMPSHIYFALGMWDKGAELNERSFAASDERRQRKNLPITSRSYHALQWLMYAYLQQGRVEDARRQLAMINSDNQEASTGGSRYHLALMRATYIIESGADGFAENLLVDTEGMDPHAVVADRFATGYAAVANSDFAAADAELAAIRAYLPTADEGRLPDSPKMAQIMALQLDGLIQYAKGNPGAGLALLQEAANLEDELPLDYGPVMPTKPSHELFAEKLLEQGHAEDAVHHFEQALARAPNRTLSVQGLRSAEAALAVR